MRDIAEARTARGTSSTHSAGQENLEQLAVPCSGVRPLLQQLRRADRALYQHSLQVWALTQQLATFLEYSDEEQTICALAALVHDVGKLTLPRTLLDKPSRLTLQETALMQQHPVEGVRLLQQVGVDEAIVTLVSHHHERWDGQGYPDGLAGLDIPRGSRLVAITDAFAAMTTTRSYQPARSVCYALQELERGAGTHFDPLLVQQCLVYLRQHDNTTGTQREEKHHATHVPCQHEASRPGG